MLIDLTVNLILILNLIFKCMYLIHVLQMEEDSESMKTALARACLAEQDHYEMQVRSANIVSE